MTRLARWSQPDRSKTRLRNHRYPLHSEAANARFEELALFLFTFRDEGGKPRLRSASGTGQQRPTRGARVFFFRTRWCRGFRGVNVCDLAASVCAAGKKFESEEARWLIRAAPACAATGVSGCRDHGGRDGGVTRDPRGVASPEATLTRETLISLVEPRCWGGRTAAVFNSGLAPTLGARRLARPGEPLSSCRTCRTFGLRPRPADSR